MVGGKITEQVMLQRIWPELICYKKEMVTFVMIKRNESLAWERTQLVLKKVSIVGQDVLLRGMFVGDIHVSQLVV